MKTNNCLCCNKELEKTLCEDGSIMFLYGGTFQDICVGYGSVKHDGDSIEFSICDDCITEKIKNGNMFVQGNFFEKLNELPKFSVVTPEQQQSIHKEISKNSYIYSKEE